ncbi:hypothetical protein [Botrimarina sp.]|uniref:hypothetical protein n=1 Tax=Botrimarina sp. TaxID=2795802 RepID=UPI0032EED050
MTTPDYHDRVERAFRACELSDANPYRRRVAERLEDHHLVAVLAEVEGQVDDVMAALGGPHRSQPDGPRDARR